MDNTRRIKLYHWIVKNVAKTPEGCVLPSWVLWVWRMLFPLKAIYYRTARREGYQPITNTWKIRGRELSSEFFEQLAVGNGDKFQIVSRDNGTITVERC